VISNYWVINVFADEFNPYITNLIGIFLAAGVVGRTLMTVVNKVL
jgi:hypothetical protein